MKIHCITAGYEAYDKIEVPLGGRLIRNQPDPRQVSRGETRVYTFERNKNLDLVAEVDKPGDIMRLLNLRDIYEPYGDDARAEAIEKYGWTPEAPTTPQAQQLAAGQPPVQEEIIGDDDDLDVGEGEPVDTGEDDDDLVPPATPINENGLPAPPADDADGELWMAWAKALPGIEDPNNRDQLAEYASQNYGIDLDRRLGVLKQLKQIAEAQAKAIAA